MRLPGNLDSLVISRISPAGRCRDTLGGCEENCACPAIQVEHHLDRSLTTGGAVAEPEMPRRPAGVEHGRDTLRVRTRGFYICGTFSCRSTQILRARPP